MDTETILEQAKTSVRDKGYVDVVKMANDLGIGVFGVRGDDDDFNAKIEYEKATDSFKLYINENHSVERQRFSIAHELGHYILHSAELKELGKLDRGGDSTMEAAADQLAAEILIPKTSLDSYIESQGFDAERMDKKSIFSVANKFKVSKGMAILRLRELDYYVPFIQFS